MRISSVFILFFKNQKTIEVFFTKRSLKMSHHAGQVSFPGGVVSITDYNFKYTALRETNEEIGISKNEVFFVRKLRSFSTVSGFLIIPSLGFLEKEKEIFINYDEVEKVLIIPLFEVFNKNNYKMVWMYWRKVFFKQKIFVYGKDIIWGVTMRIFLDLLEEFHGK